MNDVLIVVDMQVDFVSGALGSSEAQKIVPRVVRRIQGHHGPVFVTQDTHSADYLTTQEGHHLPVRHCQEESDGWQLVPEVSAALKGRPFTAIKKDAFGSPDLAEQLRALHAEHPLTSITFVGLCTDICVISNALIAKAFLPEVPIYVDAAACAGVSPESHQTALAAMQACQVVITNA